MKPINFSLIIISLFILSSCLWPKHDVNVQPDALVLPPETQEGKGVFACKINGKTYVDNRFLNTISYDPYLGPSNMNFGGIFNDKINGKTSTRSIIFFLHVPIGQKIKSDTSYQLTVDRIGSSAVYIYDQFCNYYTSVPLKSTLTITKLDTIKQIVSGRFNMLVTNSSCNAKDTVKITDGIFDINYTF